MQFFKERMTQEDIQILFNNFANYKKSKIVFY
jgi:hypothetical protein